MSQSNFIWKYFVHMLLATCFLIILFSICIRQSSIASRFDHYLLKTPKLNNLTGSQSNTDNQSIKHSLKSDKRGYVALLYSGTARSFSGNFLTHIVNLMAGCPYTVHLFFHTYTNDDRFPGNRSDSYYASYLSVNATLEYYEGYTNLDNENVLFRNAVKANVFERVPLKSLIEKYKDTFNASVASSPPHPPMRWVYYMWHSQLRSEELRQKYMNTTGIDYKWTFRMRHDAVYYTNWWQRAFDIQIYNASNPIHRLLEYDVLNDWGTQPTLLYDMVYVPRLKLNDQLYIPFGWTWGGYNDQFAAMASQHAHHYFTRILHVDLMLKERRVHPETSILLVARWNNITVNNVDGTICYDVVRVPSESSFKKGKGTQRYQPCSYKGSGGQDCRLLCLRLKGDNEAFRRRFLYGNKIMKHNNTISYNQTKQLIMTHLSFINMNRTSHVTYNDSSFYYLYVYVTSKYANDPCLLSRWTDDQTRNNELQHLPFILRASDHKKKVMYRKYLTCGAFNGAWL